MNGSKIKANAKTSILDTNTSSDIYAIRWCKLHQWLSRQSSTASVRWNHGSSSKHCCIVFQIL